MILIEEFKLKLISSFILLFSIFPLYSEPLFTSNPEVKTFINKMVSEHNFMQEELQSLFKSGQYQEKVIRIMDRQPEGTMTWSQYKKIMINPSRINLGKEFIKNFKQDLIRAEDIYGVPAEVIAAIIGIETRFGKNTGSTKVLDSLLTLSFEYPRREKFFKTQLMNFLLLAREEGLDPRLIKGSIAGAMGYGQFMPDSYRDYAVDFNYDGQRDLFSDATDAIGSVANFLSKKGRWKPNSGIAVKAFLTLDRPNIKSTFKPSLSILDLEAKGLIPVVPLMANQKFIPIELEIDEGFEYWIGMENYRALSRYNRSKLYIMAVIELSNSLVEYL